MQQYEIQTLIDGVHKRNKDSWEQTRFLAYIAAQINSSKKIKIQDIMTLPWDNTDDTIDTSISKEDIHRLQAKASKYIEKAQCQEQI